MRENISVCMATYNGEEYVYEQLDSIIKELLTGDEIIIVDDKSDDNTIDIIRSFKDNRIKLFINEYNIGHCRSFEKAISLSRNKFIFFSDQDDIWSKGRINIMMKFLSENRIKVVNGIGVDFIGNLNDNNYKYPKIYVVRSYFFELLKSLLGYKVNRRMGCTMAFNSSLKKYILPFPKIVTQHDIWIALCGSILNTYMFINKNVLFHRVHDKNVSSVKRRILTVIMKERLLRLCSFVYLVFKILIIRYNNKSGRVRDND